MAVMLVFASCQKEEIAQPNLSGSVGVIAASYVADDGGNLGFKSAPVTPIGVHHVWSYYIDNPAQAPADPYDNYKLLNGDLFIYGSDPWDFWSVASNNPITFDMTQVYSNYSPTVQSRMVCQTLDADNQVAYLGIVDFLPNSNLFPLTIINRRLGDILIANADQLKSKPGYNFMSIQVKANMGVINPFKTWMTSGGTNSAWPTFVYDSESIVTFDVNEAGDDLLYDGLDKKIIGVDHVFTVNGQPTTLKAVEVVVVVDGYSASAWAPVPGPGYGLKLLITTDKKGWYDSQTIGVTEKDITVAVETVKIE